MKTTNGEMNAMRVAIDLDDALLAKARALTGIDAITLLVREAMEALVQRESNRRASLRLEGERSGQTTSRP